MKSSPFNTHKIGNFLIRLNSIMERIEAEGEDFITEKVKHDALEALDFIKNEFSKMPQENNHE